VKTYKKEAHELLKKFEKARTKEWQEIAERAAEWQRRHPEPSESHMEKFAAVGFSNIHRAVSRLERFFSPYVVSLIMKAEESWALDDLSALESKMFVGKGKEFYSQLQKRRRKELVERLASHLRFRHSGPPR